MALPRPILEALPEPNLVDRDAEGRLAALKQRFEELTNRTLYPGQAEQLWLDLLAYSDVLLREAIQDAGKQNLLAYSRAPMLDHQGSMLGVKRLGSSFAQTVLRFSIDETAEVDKPIPLGVRAEPKGGMIGFETLAAAVIPKGAMSVDVRAQCTTPGSAGNGFTAGQIQVVVDQNLLPGVQVVNISTSAGALDDELDEGLRVRVQLAPDSLSGAGPKGAYVYHTKSVRQDVADVAVRMPEPGKLQVYPLLTTGLPDSTLLDMVRARFRDEDVTPFTDWVEVVSPIEVQGTVDIALTLYRTMDGPTAVAEVERRALSFAAILRSMLGLDLVAEQWEGLAEAVPGIYSAHAVVTPERVLSGWEWPNVISINVTIAGLQDG